MEQVIYFVRGRIRGSFFKSIRNGAGTLKQVCQGEGKRLIFEAN